MEELNNTTTFFCQYLGENGILYNYTNATGAHNDDNNLTGTIQCLEHAPQLTSATLLRVGVLILMAMVSLLGNIATIWNIRKKKLSRRIARHNCSAVYHLVFHLSIADILVTAFCIAGDAVWSYTVEWIAGEFLCKVFKFSQMFSLYLSTYVLVLIGVDRWVAVKYPMKSLNTATRCNRLLCSAYILAVVLSIPQGIIFRVVKGPFIEDFYQCHTAGFYTAKWQEQAYTTFTLVFMFVIPLVIIITTYLSTFRTISGSAQIFNLGPSNGSFENGHCINTRRRLIHKAKKKSAKISLVIVVAFVVCWTPYYVMMLIFMFWNPDKDVGDTLQSVIFFFGMSNSLVNPIIYGAFHLWPIKKVPLRNRREQSITGHHTNSTNGASLYRQHSAKYNQLNRLTPENSIRKEKIPI